MKADEIILIQRVVYSLLLLFLFLCVDNTVVLYDFCKLLFVVRGPSEEFVLEQFICAWSLLGVLGQALWHKVLELSRPFLLNRRWLVLQNIDDDTTLRLVDIRRVAVGQLHCEYAETPDVYFCIVASLSFNQFWSHPTDCAYFTWAHISFLSQLSGISKVGKFDFSFWISQYVVWLDVSMHNVLIVEELETQ